MSIKYLVVFKTQYVVALHGKSLFVERFNLFDMNQTSPIHRKRLESFGGSIPSLSFASFSFSFYHPVPL